MTRRKRSPESVAVVATDHGHAFRAERGWARLEAPARRALVALEEATDHLRLIEKSRRALVSEARAHGASWHQIGLSLATTGDAVRRRYGFDQEDDD